MRSGLIAVPLLTAALAAAPSEAAEGVRTRIVEDACGRHDLAGDERSAGDAALGAVLDNTLGRLGAALRRAGEASSRGTVIQRNLEVAPGNPARCLIVARGRWGTGDAYRDPRGTRSSGTDRRPRRCWPIRTWCCSWRSRARGTARR